MFRIQCCTRLTILTLPSACDVDIDEQAFIFDPDGYSIEILSANQMAKDFSQYAEGASK